MSRNLAFNQLSSSVLQQRGLIASFLTILAAVEGLVVTRDTLLFRETSRCRRQSFIQGGSVLAPLGRRRLCVIIS